MNPVLIAYGALGAAITLEVAGTTFLAKSEQFTRVGPGLACLVLYAASFYCLSLALKSVPLGIAYASWGGLGIVLTALIGVFVFKNSFDWAAIVGIVLIVAGVLIMNLLSNTATHG